MKVCWAPDTGQARKTLHRLWPNEEIPGEAAQLLPLPRHFGELAQLVPEEAMSAPAGPDPAAHLAGVRAYVEAGFERCTSARAGESTKASSSSTPAPCCRGSGKGSRTRCRS